MLSRSAVSPKDNAAQEVVANAPCEFKLQQQLSSALRYTHELSRSSASLCANRRVEACSRVVAERFSMFSQIDFP